MGNLIARIMTIMIVINDTGLTELSMFRTRYAFLFPQVHIIFLTFDIRKLDSNLLRSAPDLMGLTTLAVL